VIHGGVEIDIPSFASEVELQLSLLVIMVQGFECLHIHCNGIVAVEPRSIHELSLQNEGNPP
jgi:hypothetical protein